MPEEQQEQERENAADPDAGSDDDSAAESARQEEEEVGEAKEIMSELEEGEPSSLRHHEDGSVTIEGEAVDDPEEYKGEPIPGGPSDPDAPPDPEAESG